jgi:tetratricopeptide (TPR) repeat protein
MATREQRHSAKAPKKQSPPNRWLVLGIALATALVAGSAWFLQHRNRLSSATQDAALVALPALDLTGIDPAVIRAIEKAEAAVQQAPRSVQAWGQLGQTLLAHDIYLPAATCLAQAEQLDPDQPRWPYLQGIALTSADPPDPEAAIQKFQRAVELGGDHPDTLRLRLAETLLGQDRLDEAEQPFQHVVELNPANARAHLGLARVAIRRGELEKSQSHLEHTLGDPHAQKASRQLLAEVQQRLGKEPSAVELHEPAELPADAPWPDPYWEEAMRLRTGMKAQLYRAERWLRQGRLLDAVPLLQQTVHDYPDSYYAWLVYGRALIKQRNLKAAEQALSTALKLAPDSAETQFHLGVALYLQGNYRNAEAMFRSATELQPNYAQAHYNLGHCLLKKGDRDGAIEAFRTALRCQADYVDAHTSLSELLAEKGQRDEALTHARLALQYNPADPFAKNLLQRLTGQKVMPAGP